MKTFIQTMLLTIALGSAYMAGLRSQSSPAVPDHDCELSQADAEMDELEALDEEMRK